MSIIIRNVVESDLDALMELKKQVGWNHLPADWLFIIKNYADTSLVAMEGERLAGCAAGIHFGKLAWIGQVAVDVAFRNRGIASSLMNQLVTMLKDRGCVSIKLDARSAAEGIYLKMGFQPEYLVIRMVHPDFQDANYIAPSVSHITPEDMPEILEQDRKVFGADRSPLLERYLREFPECAFKHRSGRLIDGYVFGRNGMKMRQICPLVARSYPIARALVEAAAGAGGPLVIDVIETHSEFCAMLKAWGFTNLADLRRMNYGEVNLQPLHPDYYAIAGYEFG